MNHYIFQDECQKPLLSYKGPNPLADCYMNIEQVSIMCKDIFLALTSLIASIYLFNVQYPEKLLETFTFIEVYLLNFKHDQKVSKKVLRLIKRLEDFI